MSTPELNLELLAAAVERIPPDALSGARQDALLRFGNSGIPKVSQEEWKYTNLAPIALLGNEWLSLDQETTAPTGAPGALEQQALQEIDAHWITLVDGKIQSGDTSSLPGTAGLSVRRLSESPQTSLIDSDNQLGNLNLALLQDGLHIVLAADTSLDKPLGLLISNSGTAGGISQERILIEVENGASMQVVECHLSSSAEPYFTNTVIQVNLGASAQLDHVRLQNTGNHHMLVGRTHAELDTSSTYSHATYDFGGRLIRNDFFADINGRDASVNMHGLYLASGEQHVDNHTCVNHRVGPAVSNEEFRGILNGTARCVFNGKAVVFEGADGTDARQANHNLLLSDAAEIDTKPELEIYADDVKCSHGATVGQLDESSLFYLRSRGIAREDAVQMLTHAFAAAVVDECPLESCQPFLAQLLEQKLNEMAIHP